MEKSRDGSCEGAKDKRKSGGTYAAAGELPVVGGSIGGERVGDGGKNCTWEAVKSTPESAGEKFWLESGQDGNEKADGEVGEKKASRKKSSGLNGDSLKPGAEGGEKAEEASCPNGAP